MHVEVCQYSLRWQSLQHSLCLIQRQVALNNFYFTFVCTNEISKWEISNCIYYISFVYYQFDIKMNSPFSFRLPNENANFTYKVSFIQIKHIPFSKVESIFHFTFLLKKFYLHQMMWWDIGTKNNQWVASSCIQSYTINEFYQCLKVFSQNWTGNYMLKALHHHFDSVLQKFVSNQNVKKLQDSHQEKNSVNSMILCM